MLQVTPSYFEVLGSAPAMGRMFDASEQQAGAHVVVISHDLWQNRLNADPSVTGTSIEIGGEPYTIAGVAREGIEDPVAGAIDVWQPLVLDLTGGGNNHRLTVYARLRPGATVAALNAELASLDTSLGERYPDVADEQPFAFDLQDNLVGASSRMLYVLLGAVGLVLLIACVNIANLLLVRATSREREFVLRAALGSGRRRIVTQLLLESLVLATAGGVLGIMFASYLVDAIVALGSGSIPRLADTHIDLPVLLFAAGAAFVSAMLFGLLPALRFSRVSANGVLRDTARSVTAGRGRTTLRATLVAAQIALAFMLVAGAGILTLSFARIRAIDPGFESRNVATWELSLPAARYTPAQRAQFHEQLAAKLEALPGVSAAGAISRLPLTGSYHSWGGVALTGPRASEEKTWTATEHRVIAGDYFDAMQIPLLSGRLFDTRDDTLAPMRAVVSRSFADELFPGVDAIGQRFRAAGEDLEIIGVVADVALTPEGTIAPTVYHAHRQFAADRNWPLTYVVRAQSEPSGLMPLVRNTLNGMDQQLVLYKPAPLEDVLGTGTAQRRFTLSLMSSFAIMALLLASLGIFGVISFVVRQRRREIGIRAALGARPSQIRSLVIGQGLRMTAAGIVAGVIGALALGRVLQALVFDTTPTDPVILIAAALAMTAAAAAAAYLPMREAIAIQPANVLQEE
jgi:putative ABC transport system permease protein